MKLKKLLKLYDNWNDITRVNDDNLKMIVEDNTLRIVETQEELLNKKVVAFGFYDGIMTVRVK